jgi:hypothetical protein
VIVTEDPARPTRWTSPAAAYRVGVGDSHWELADATLAQAIAWAEARAEGGAYTLDVVTPHGPGIVQLVGEAVTARRAETPMARPRSATIPAGLTVELSRATVMAGRSHEADRWMQMLEDRADECVATLDAERMALEIIFRLRDSGKDHLFWVSIHGEGRGLDLENPIDRDHVEQAMRTKEPGWVAAEPQLLLLPAPVREAIESWALRPQD